MLTAGSTGEAFNIGNDEEVTIAELAQVIDDAAGNGMGVAYETSDDPAYLEDNPSRRSPDLRKLTEAVGWRPSIDLREGIARTLAYYRAESGR